MYIVWETELQEYYVFIGVASTKEKANSMLKRAYKALKNKDSTPEDFNENNFKIEKIRDGEIHKDSIDGY